MRHDARKSDDNLPLNYYHFFYPIRIVWVYQIDNNQVPSPLVPSTFPSMLPFPKRHVTFLFCILCQSCGSNCKNFFPAVPNSPIIMLTMLLVMIIITIIVIGKPTWYLALSTPDCNFVMEIPGERHFLLRIFTLKGVVLSRTMWSLQQLNSITSLWSLKAAPQLQVTPPLQVHCLVWTFIWKNNSDNNVDD